MSLLLFFNPSAGEPPPADIAYVSPRAVPPWGIDIEIDEILRNDYVRAIDNFDITYNLQNRGILRCQIIDEEVAGAYHPQQKDPVQVIDRVDGTIYFTGRVLRARTSSLQPGSGMGTRIDVDVIDDSQILEHAWVERVFGTDPKPIQIAYQANPGVIQTHEPHGFTTGDWVTIDGNESGAVNGTFQITVIDTLSFSIPVNNTMVGGSGAVRQRFHLGTIVAWIANNVLAPWGITLDPEMQLGPLLEKQTFDAPAEQVFQQLSKLTGWPFRLLPTGVFEMFAAGTKDSSFVFDGDNVLGAPEILEDSNGYANTVRVSYGGSTRIDKNTPIIGDGSRRRWPMPYKPATAGSVSLVGQIYNPALGTYANIGVYGVDTLFEWVYDEATQELVQLEEWAGLTNWPALSAGEQRQAIFPVQFPQVVTVANNAAVAADGGPFVKRITVENVFDIEAAKAEAQAALDLAQASPREITVSTRGSLLFPGTTAAFELPERGITGLEWLVMSTTIREDRDGQFRYTYRLLEDNKIKPGWIDFFKGIARGGSSSGTVTSAVAPPSSGGGGSSAGTGTPDRIAKWSSNVTLGDSVMTEDAEGVVVAGRLQSDYFVSGVFRGTTSPGDAFRLEDGNGSRIFNVPQGGQHVHFASNIYVGGSISTPAATALLINPTGELVVQPGTPNVVPALNYQTNLGKIDKKFLTLWAAELWVETLVAQETIATIGGEIMVGPTTPLALDLAPTDTFMVTKYNNLAVGDRVFMKAFGKMEYMQITSGPTGSAGAWTYGVTRNLDGSGANQWYAGDAVFNTGDIGDGFINIYAWNSIRNNGIDRGPTIAGNLRYGLAWNEYEVRWAVGNLKGLYYYPNDTWGAAFGDPNGSWAKIDASRLVMGTGGGPGPYDNWKVWIEGGNAWFTGIITVQGGNAAMTDMSNVTTIDGGKITTNTLNANRIIAGTITADKMNVTTLSAISANLGTVTIGVSGYLATSGISWGSGTGVFMGWTGAAYGIRAGNPAGDRFIWDGSQIEIVAGGVEIDSASGITAGNARMDASGLSLINSGAINLGGGEIYGINLFGQLYLKGFSEVILYTNGATRVYVDSAGTLHTLGGMRFVSLAGGGDRAVRVNNNGDVYAA